MQTATTSDLSPRDRILACASELGLTMTAEFVPLSQSRNANETFQGKPRRTLNWRVTIERAGRPILTTDYSSGEAHCPAYRDKAILIGVRQSHFSESVTRDRLISLECERGAAMQMFGGSAIRRKSAGAILPDFADVLYGLSSDASVLDSPCYEDWASEFGYEPDSRKGEAIYRACLGIALKLRAAIGEAGLEALRSAAQDY